MEKSKLYYYCKDNRLCSKYGVTKRPFQVDMDASGKEVLKCPGCSEKEIEVLEPQPIVGGGIKKEPVDIKKIGVIAAGVLLIGGLIFFFVGKSSDKEASTETIDKVTDTASVPVPLVEEPEQTVEVVQPEPVKPFPKAGNTTKNSGGSAPKGMQTLSIGGNTYKGEAINGKPHGMGTIYYKQSTQISPKDLKKRMAESGDYLTGEFYEGNPVQGKLFDAGNNVKEIIMIGR